MSTEIVVNVQERATTDLQRISAAVESEDIHEVMGAAAALEVQHRLTRLDSERPNQLGGKRTHWYAGAADGTTHHTVPEGAAVDITQAGIRTMILGTAELPGGAIVPKNAKHLAIPARAEAHGRSPREFDDLMPLYRSEGGHAVAYALAQAEQQTVDLKRRRKDGTTSRSVVKGGGIFYWLVDSVVQEPDPTILPTEDELRRAIFGAVDGFFATLQGGVFGV